MIGTLQAQGKNDALSSAVRGRQERDARDDRRPPIEALYADAPPATLLKAPLDLPRGKSEIEVERFFARLAARNMPASRAPFFVGAGAYKHHVPASVDHLIQRSEFLTSYTPYQPEISQGTLQYLFEFQTQVALLTGMEVANASMYDGSTATAEAVLMAHRVTKRRKALLSGGLHPHYAEVVRTISRLAEDEVDDDGRLTFAAPKISSRASTTRSPASSCRRPTSSAICAI